MTVPYQEFAVPVDPEFARQLKAQLDARRVTQHGSPKPSQANHQAIRVQQVTEVPLVLMPDKQPDQKWRRVGLLAAAGIVVLAAGAVLVFATSDDDADPRPAATLPPESSAPATVAPPSSTEAQEAIDIAQRFVEARDRWDGAAVRALVADDAVINDLAVSTADDYLAAAQVEQATGWRYMEPSCRATVGDPPVQVTCAYVMQNAWSQALGVGPFTGSRFYFVIDNGQIEQVNHGFDFSRFSQVYNVFFEWVSDAHPGDVDLMIADSSGNFRLTPEAIALFEQHTTEFEAVQTGMRFVEARDRWDGAAVRALVADDAVINDLAVSTADDYLAAAQVEQATGWRYMEPSCRATVGDPPVQVTCAYVMQNAWSQALGVGPFTGSRFYFVIDNGQIEQVNHGFDFSRFSQVYNVFFEWVSDAHPGDADVMIADSSGNFRLTPEAIALFEQYTTEFVSSRNNSGSD